MYVIGIDPDSKAHGVAVYENGKLIDLFNLELFQIIDLVNGISTGNIIFSIENVLANNFLYARNTTGNKLVDQKKMMRVGRCQQSQTELMRYLDRAAISYFLHKPTRGNWAKNKSLFEKVTGWTKRSNEDTRSAAFFGFLAIG